MNSTIAIINTTDAIAIITELKPNNFRNDQVIVDCQSATETFAVVNVALQALENGYVEKIEVSKTGSLRVLIDFHKHPLVV